MRRIKLRAWDVETECYIDEKDWAGITPEGQNIWIVEEEEASALPILGGFIIEQYTGLKDKNGKEIYENDIVSEHNGDIKGKVVQSITGEWQIAWIGILGGYSCLYDHTPLCEVIGNVHESNMEELCPRE